MDLGWLRAARNLLILGAMFRGRSVLLVACAGLLLALGAAGCLTAHDSGAEAPGDDATGACVEDVDCVLAGPSCCACPTYALPVGSGFVDACDGVDCPLPGEATCAPLVARCDQGACVAACAPASCELVCPGGFVVDATGCLACMCAAAPPADECAVDGDCARVPADCCGCDRGGNDTAVPVGRVSEHDDGLMCVGTEACPGVSTCTAGAEPRCQLGRCVLAGPTAEPGGPAGACGRPELPPCPTGQQCVINDNDAAGSLGVGVCRPAP